MTSRRLLMATGGGGSFTAPPPLPAFLSAAHNNDYAGGGSFDNFLHMFESDDGITWTKLGSHDLAGSIYPSRGARDPSLLLRDGKWWIVATSVMASDIIEVFGTPDADYSTGWALIASPSTGTPTASWAPQWFVDSDNSVHVLVALQFSGARKIYEMHPTNGAMTTWSSPVEVTGSGFVTNTIDAHMRKLGSTYYLFWKDDDASVINLSTSTSPFSGYSAIKTGDWAGWKSGLGSIEGAQTVPIATGWRIYFSHNSGFNAVNIYYSETTAADMLSGWSARTAIASFATYNHPLPIVT